MTAEDDDIAKALNGLPKYVASRSLRHAEWARTIILYGDVSEAVGELKAGTGNDLIVVGSSELAQTLMRHDLVDEYQLWVHPVVLGSGKRLFGGGAPKTAMQLVDATKTVRGLVILTYTPAVGGHG